MGPGFQYTSDRLFTLRVISKTVFIEGMLGLWVHYADRCLNPKDSKGNFAQIVAPRENPKS